MTATSPVVEPLRVHGLVKAFDDVVAVDHVDLALEPGEVLSLVGPSGCGKSTLLRAIAGLVPIDSGSVFLAGEIVDDGKVHLPPERRATGLVFQEHALFPHLTVQGNVEFGIRDVAGSERTDRALAMLDMVGLGGLADRFPHELSGGERQRVALARALAPAPALMLFDEPFASLDYNLRVQLRHDVIAVLRATNTPAIFVTHDQREALALGDRIAVMRAGRIVQVGTPAEVFHEPADQFVAAFMGDASFLPVHASADGLHTALGALPREVDATAAAVAMVRPDDVVFSPDAAAVGCAATVTRADYHGMEWLGTAQLSDGTEILFATPHLDRPAVGANGCLVLREGHAQVPLPASE